MELTTQFAFAPILEEIHLLFTPQVAFKNLQFSFNDLTNGQFYLGDPMRVRQIIVNLVSNAVKFTEQGSVTIETRLVEPEAKAPGIVIAVRDTGIGIAPDKLATIIAQYAQQDMALTPRHDNDNSGLSLSIAYMLSRMMGGDIAARSEPGKGSEFVATLGLQPCNGSSPEICVFSEFNPHAAGNSGTGTILLVDDYEPSIMVATMMLETMGYNVIAVQSGRQALETMRDRHGPFKAILMDLQMQDMDGLETARQIRALEAAQSFCNIIIGVTAHALAGDHECCLRAGMDDYMSKPINHEILAAKLRRFN